MTKLISSTRFDPEFVLQACTDFYFSIGYGFMDLRSVDPIELLSSLIHGTSIREPQPFAWDPPSSSVLRDKMNQLFDDLEA